MAENSMCCMNWEQMNSEKHLYEKKAEEINNQKQNEMELPMETSGGKYFVHGTKTETLPTCFQSWKVTKEYCSSVSTA